MSPPGHAAEGLPADSQTQEAVKKLEQEPKAQENRRRQDEIGTEDKRRHQRLYFGVRVKTEVGPHDTRNRSAGADSRNRRTSVSVDMHERGSHATREIQQDVSRPTQPVFHVVAEDPEDPHVAQQMQPATVQKHGSEKRDDLIQEAKLKGHLGSGVTRGNDRVIEQRFLEVGAQAQFMQEYENVQNDYCHRRRRKARRRNVITKRQHKT